MRSEREDEGEVNYSRIERGKGETDKRNTEWERKREATVDQNFHAGLAPSLPNFLRDEPDADDDRSTSRQFLNHDKIDKHNNDPPAAHAAAGRAGQARLLGLPGPGRGPLAEAGQKRGRAGAADLGLVAENMNMHLVVAVLTIEK